MFFSSDPAVSSSIFVGAEREENLIRNDPDKSEFTSEEEFILKNEHVFRINSTSLLRHLTTSLKPILTRRFNPADDIIIQ